MSKNNFPYLNDKTFLKNFDELKLKQQYVKLVVLTFNEVPIKQIQGRLISGNINLDSSSSMRRTGSLNLVLDDGESEITNIRNLLAINKKIEVFIGFLNTTDEYLDYPIIWFPQGVYVIISPNITHNSQGINVSLTIHDKMALLNGECGGVLPASVIFHEVEDVDQNGQTYIRNPTIFQIITELVNHFGGQQLGKIIINDIDNHIKQVMKWTGSSPLYLGHKMQSDGSIYYAINTDYQALKKDKQVDFQDKEISSFYYGEDVGYILTDFIYPGELIGNAGDSVVTILDNIKNVLGNYEYFYDIHGNFVFQEIKNYLNNSYSTTILKNNGNDYLIDYNNGKSVYSFDNANIIQSFSNTPQYQQIKNDFLIWGKRTTIEGNEVPIRYHLTIDDKPVVGNSYNVVFYTDEDNIEKAKIPFRYDADLGNQADSFNIKDNFPKNGQVDRFYVQKEPIYYRYDSEVFVQVPKDLIIFVNQLPAKNQREDVYYILANQANALEVDSGTASVRRWNSKTGKYVTSTPRYFQKKSSQAKFSKSAYYLYEVYEDRIYTWDADTQQYQKTNHQIETITSTDYRTQLYMAGVQAQQLGLASNEYYAELKNEWPKLYDLRNGTFLESTLKDPSSIDFYLDFIDFPAAVSQFNVKNIGRRTVTLVDDKINCLFEPDNADIIIIQQDNPDTEPLRELCEKQKQDYIQVSDSIYSMLLPGGYLKSAYEEIRKELYQYTKYSEQISLTTLPVYYLEPNQRITVRDSRSNIYGDYIIKSISLPLDISGTMNITCSKAYERI